jgi:hypothetical protein
MGCLSLRAQDIAGTWQGAMQPAKGQAGKKHRIVVKIAKDGGSGWQGVVYNLEGLGRRVARAIR